MFIGTNLQKLKKAEKVAPEQKKYIHQNLCGSTQHIFSGKVCLLERANQIW
jgi:hypothetical protein